ELRLGSDGGIVAAAVLTTGQSSDVLGLVRFDSSGKLDASFSSNGLIQLTEAKCYDLVYLQDDGSVIVSIRDDPMSLSQSLFRCEQDGELDQTFASGAGVHFSSAVYPVRTMPDGTLILHLQWDGMIGSRLVRLNSDGSI